MNKLLSSTPKLASCVARFPAVVIAVCALIPIVIVAIGTQLFASDLRPWLPKGVDLNIFGALRHVAHLYAWSGNDSWGPMQRAIQVLHSPSKDKIYETVFFREHLRFQYPLTSLLPIEMLAGAGVTETFGLNAINLCVFLLDAIAVGAFAYLIAENTASDSQPRWLSREREMFAFAAGLAALLFYPLVRACVLGQIQIWIDFLFTAALLCWILDWRLCAGLVLGLASSIKPQFGLFLVWGILWREWRFSGGLVMALAPVAATAIVLYGAHNAVFYFSVLSFLAQHGESFFANNSMNGILNWYFSGMNSLHWNGERIPPYNDVVYFGTLAGSIIFALPILLPPFLNRGQKASLAYFGVAAICTVIGSPVAWEHHYGILLPLYVVAIRNAFLQKEAKSNHIIVGTLIASWTLVADFIPFLLPFAGTKFALVQAYCFFGAVMLLGVLLATAPNARRGSAA